MQLCRNNLIANLEASGTNVVVSVHEHTLQIIENDNQYFVVSGSATKRSKVKMGKGSMFATGEKGYAKIVFKNKSQATLQPIVPGHHPENDNIAYEREIEF